MRHVNRGVATAVLAVCLALGGVACGSDDAGVRGVDGSGQVGVAAEEDGSGVETAQLLLTASPVVVVSAPDEAAQARAASVAVGLRAPMFTAVAGGDADLAEEISRLGVERVLRVGQVTFEPDEGEVVDAPADPEELADLIGVEFDSQVEVDADDLDDVTARQEPGSPELMAVGEFTAGAGTGARTDAFEAGSPVWEGDDAPRILVSEDTPVAAIATAVAIGGAVTHLALPDPRVDGSGVDAVREAETVFALGPGWGARETLEERIEQAVTVPELPGGGQLVFPGRRFVAAYGSPVTPALGVLGEQGPEESVALVQGLVEQYQSFSPQPVIPAFEIIGTVASAAPGDDGNFTNEWAPEKLLPLVDAIAEAGGYAVIDLQPGMADMVDQATVFEELLKRPDVGLALDPEWKLQPGQQPGAQIGSVDADEINRVIDWLADLTRDSGGPQKLLILHQFSTAMITDRDQIDTSRPELAISLHADGHGTPDLKMETWDSLRKGLSPDIWMAWKNFYDEDTPTFTPAQTMAVEPRPWFVSYQ